MSTAKRLSGISASVLLVFALLISMAIAFTVAPRDAYADTPSYDYTLYIEDGKGHKNDPSGDEVDLSSLNITYDAMTNTYIFDGVDFQTSASVAVEIRDDADDEIIIDLHGNNVIACGDSSGDFLFGIFAYRNLTIKGSGSLTVSTGDTTGTDEMSAFAIFAINLKIKDATVTAIGGDSAHNSDAFVADDAVFENAKVTAISGDAKHYSTAFYVTESFDINNSIVEATTGNAGEWSFGIDTTSINIRNNSTVTIAGGSADYASDGIYALNLTITDSIVEAFGGNADTHSCGIWVSAGDDVEMENQGMLYVRNSKLTTSGASISGKSYGTACDDLTVNNSTIVGKAQGTGLGIGCTNYAPESELVVYAGDSETDAVATKDWNGRNGNLYTRIEPFEASVSIDPKTAEVAKGSTKQFGATTNLENPTMQWFVHGNESLNTSIDANGLLTVGSDETAAELTVEVVVSLDDSKSTRAAANAISDEAQVKVVEPADAFADSTDAEKPTADKTLAQTGDNAPFGIALITLAIALAGLVVARKAYQ